VKEFEIAVVFTGHIIDSADRKTPRFPEEMCGLATVAIGNALLPYVLSRENLVLISSLARGADIIAVETALSLDIPVRVVLPQPIDIFEVASPFGHLSWKMRFKMALAEVGKKNITILDGKNLGDAADYVAANEKMLSMAEALGNKVVLMAFWDGSKAALPGGTACFASSVIARGGEVDHIDANMLLELHLARKASNR
jgi:hypothetical protein